MCSPDLKPVLRYLPFFFSTLEDFLRQSEVPLPKYAQKRVFVGLESCFTLFVISFLLLWMFYCVYRRYHCQEKAKNVFSPGLKLVLRHSLFFFNNFRGFFVLIRGIVVRYGHKSVFAGFETDFTAFVIIFLALW